MRAVYRMAAALLAILSGLGIALLIRALTDEGEIKIAGFVLVAVVAALCAAGAVALWARALRDRDR